MKETEEDMKKWKDIHAHGLEEQISLKCWYYPKQSTHLMQSPLKPTAFFTEQEQSQNLYGSTKDPEQPKQSWKRKAEVEASQFQTSDYVTEL